MTTKSIIEIRNQLFGGSGAQQDMGTGGGGSSATKGKDNRSMWKKYVSDSRVNKLQKGFFKKLGVSFGVAQVLKQSQIFTSLFGTLFQIIGAVVDVILAPLTKYLAPLLQKFATWSIENAQKVAEKFETLLDWMANEEGFFLNFIKDIWTVTKLLWDMIFNPAKIIDRIIPGLDLHSKYEDFKKVVADKVWETVKKDLETQWKSVEDISSSVGTFATDSWKWMEDTLPDKIDAVYGNVEGLYDDIKLMWDPLIKWIKEKLGWVEDKIEDGQQKIEDAKKEATNIFQGVMSGLADGIGNLAKSNDKSNSDLYTKMAKDSAALKKSISEGLNQYEKDNPPPDSHVKHYDKPKYVQNIEGSVEGHYKQKADLEALKNAWKLGRPKYSQTMSEEANFRLKKLEDSMKKPIFVNKWVGEKPDAFGEAIIHALDTTSKNMYENQMNFTDQQLREHTKTDFDSMLAARQNNSRGLESMGSW